jgi:hypothetical protein
VIARLALLAAWTAPPAADLFRPDEPPFADGDLMTYRRQVPDARNGFIAVNLDLEEVAWPEDIGPRLTGQEDPFDSGAASGVVLANEAVFARLETALVAPDFQVPEASGFDDHVGYLLAFRRIAYAVSARGRLRFEAGDEEAACEDALLLIRMGQRIQGAQGPLVSFLTGVAIQSIGCGDLIERLEETGLSPDALARVLRVLAPVDVDVAGFRDALRAEYVILSGAFERLARGEPTGLDGEPSGPGKVLCRSPFFRPQKTKRLLGEDLRAIMECAGTPRSERRLVPAEEKYAPEKLNRRFLTSGGERILRSLVRAYEDALGEVRILEFQLAAAKVLLAIECHRRERGALPASLDDLVPRLLGAVPRDPYDGKPLRWTLETLSIHSVGSDLVDAGGSAEKGWRRALADVREPTVRLRAW